MFILNGNFSNKIDQVLMAFISEQGQRASSIDKVKKPDLMFVWLTVHDDIANNSDKFFAKP